MNDSSITTSNSTVTVGDLVLTLNFSDVSGTPGPTNTSGEIKVLVDGSAVDASDNLYAKTGSFKWWITADLDGYDGAAAAKDAALLAALKEHADDYTVTFSGTNLKFGTNEATAIANSAAGISAGTVTAQFTINVSGVIISVTASSKATHYFGVTEAQTGMGAEITLTGEISGGDIE